MRVRQTLLESLVCAGLLVGTVGAATPVLAAEAQSEEMEKYFSIGEVNVEEIGMPESDSRATGGLLGLNPSESSPLPSILPTTPDEIPSVLGSGIEGVMIDQIFNYAREVWQVVERNKPVVNVAFDNANALPVGAENWRDLNNWQPTQAKAYRVSYKNLYGITVVDFTYRILYTYGGGVNGRGKYLTNVTVVPANLEVAWFFKFNADVKVTNLTNAGTLESPVAAMTLQVHWKIDTPVKYTEQTENFYVRGDGLFINLN